MDGGVAIGVGAAMSTLAVAVRSIDGMAKKMKMNRNTIKRLGDLCVDNHFYLQQMVEEAAKIPNSDRARILEEYIGDFHGLLARIEKDLKNWSSDDFWSRIVKRGEIAEQMGNYWAEVTQKHDNFKISLSIYTFANSEETLRLTRRNSVELESVRMLVEEQTRQQRETFLRLLEQDRVEGIRHMESTTLTIQRAETVMDLSQTDFGYPDLMANRHSVMSSLQKGAHDGEDPYARQAREALLRALQVRGNRPLFTVDSSELTVPVRVHHGGHAMICQGIRDGQPVAIKQLNFEIGSPEVVLKRIQRESKIWETLDHKNIVPFIGVCGPRGIVPLMISSWMPYGNARTYVRDMQQKAEVDDDAPEPDCIKIFIDIADGLVYLHSQTPPIIHGGLKASNILIDQNHNARITDFALSAIETEVQSGSRPPPMRWSAPEVLDGEDPQPSADIYSFACVMLEIINDQDPFYGQNHLFYLHRRIREGLRPEFPRSDLGWRRGLTSPDCKLWRLMQGCWAARSEARPKAVEIRAALQEIWDERQGNHA